MPSSLPLPLQLSRAAAARWLLWAGVVRSRRVGGCGGGGRNRWAVGCGFSATTVTSARARTSQ